VRTMESLMMRRFDAVSTISGRMLDLLRAKHVPAERCHFFPNWADIQHIKPLAGSSSYRQQLGIPEHAVVCLFSGSLGRKQGLMVIPEAAQQLSTRVDIHFVVCGDGVMKPELAHAASQLGRFHLLPLQPLERLPDLLGLADIHLLPQSPEAEDLVLPSKLTGMVSSGRPIIATCNPHSEIASVVSQCGLVVPPEDAPALAQAIEQLADAPEQRRRLGDAARQYAEDQIGRDAVLGRLADDLAKLSGTDTQALSARI